MKPTLRLASECAWKLHRIRQSAAPRAARAFPMQLNYHVLDVFTDTRFGGNPLAVVLDADGLDARACRRSRASSTCPRRYSF